MRGTIRSLPEAEFPGWVLLILSWLILAESRLGFASNPAQLQIQLAAPHSPAGNVFSLPASRPVAGVYLNGRMPDRQPDPGRFRVVPAFPGLQFPNPVGLLPEPRSSRLIVHCREGQVFAFTNRSDIKKTELFLDIRERTQGWDDCGLLGMAFHPEYGLASSTNRGYVYVFYQYSRTPTSGPSRPPSRTICYNRLSRFTVPDGARAADPNSELILMNLYDRNLWHNGGAMLFHPDDRFLYLSLGDEGGASAEYGNAQRIDLGLFAGVIRIDVDQNPERSHPIRRQPVAGGSGSSVTAHYGIPNDNPFLDPAGGLLEEFWCIGLRSPHRMTLDPVARTIWLGDVGQASREEVNVIVRGGNYQWAYKEGSLDGPLRRPQTLLGFDVPPIYDYGHTRGTSGLDGDNCVIGGYVYRGSRFASELGGRYVLGDNGSGRIWILVPKADGTMAADQIATMPPGFNYSGLSSFGVDHDNELYLCQMGSSGRIFTLANPEAVAPPPALLSATGAFADLKALRPASELIPFSVNSPLWSDGAAKFRWMVLPSDGAPFGEEERIGFSASGSWRFPAGSVFIKHFELPISESDAAIRRRLETRFLVRDNSGGVYGVTYKWRPDGSDAELLSGAVTEDLSIALEVAPPSFTTLNLISVKEDVIPGAIQRLGSSGEAHAIVARDSQVGGMVDRLRLYAGARMTSDFDLKWRVAALAPVQSSVFGGFMLRESTSPSSPMIAVGLASKGIAGQTITVEVMLRDAEGQNARVFEFPFESQAQIANGNAWLRLRRETTNWTVYAGADGVAWKQLGGKMLLRLSQDAVAGVFLASSDPLLEATATFDGFCWNRAQSWTYPSPRDCLVCHNPGAGHVLGVQTAQLNGSLEGSGAIDQLSAWDRLEMFTPVLGSNAPSGFARMTAINDQTLPIDRRVRSYLAANCSQCHRPGGVRAGFDARYEVPLAKQGLVEGVLFESLGVPGARVIASGSPEQSILLQRIMALGEHQMPPLAKNVVDAEAVRVFEQWIRELPLAQPVRGLRGEYYADLNLVNLALVRTDATVAFDFGSGSPSPRVKADGFSARWTGHVEAAFSETYTFYVLSDDGARLWVDGKPLVDNWSDHGPTENFGAIALQAGIKVPIRLDYFESSGGAQIRLSWSSSRQAKQTVPSTRLSSISSAAIGVAPPLLRSPIVDKTGLRLILDTDELANYSIEASSDFVEWTVLSRLTNGLGWIEISDPQATNYFRRFYRAVTAP